tara:strand:- start:14898 stop:15140 length:243 start_codon:yes stop_codon:yes gene_type:complete
MDWDRILALIDEDEWAYHALPHYGLVADWRVRYVDLRDLILSEYKRERASRADEASGVGGDLDAEGGQEAAGVPDPAVDA